MMHLFALLLALSLTGGLLTVLAIALTPLTRRVFSAGWHRTLHCVLLLFYLLPVGPAAFWMRCLFPKPPVNPLSLPTVEFPKPLQDLVLEGQVTAQPALWTSLRQILLSLLPMLWLVGVLLFLAYRILLSARFRRGIAATSAPIHSPEVLALLRHAQKKSGVRGNIPLMENPCIPSPMLTALGRTVLILPKQDWQPQQLLLILRHELTHWKHRDLWFKRVCTAVCALHWFNPAAYLLANRLDRWMELACDEAVVQDMNDGQRRAYGHTILDAMSRGGGSPVSTTLCSALCRDKKHMKARLTAMLHFKSPTRRVKALSAALIAAVCVSGLMLGAAAYQPPETESPTSKSAAEPNASVTKTTSVGAETTPTLPDAAVPNESADSDEAEISEDMADAPPPLTYNSAGPAEFLRPVDGDYPATTYEGHAGKGVDFAPGGAGDPVYASAAGIVVKVVRGYTGYGYFAILDHGGGYQTLYGHCGSIDVEVGDEVEAGQQIATIGRTGWATGNHLHFELRQDGRFLNPLAFLPE